MRFIKARLHTLRQRFFAPPAEPLRVWLRRERWKIGPLAVAVVALLLFDGWLLTCGFQGCPSRSEVRAYRPSEGGSVLDENGRLIGHLAIVRRINVPLSQIPKHV